MIGTTLIKKIFKHICFTLIANIFKKFFNTLVQEELIIELMKYYIEKTPTKKDDDFFNIAFGDTKFKITKQ